MRRQGGRNKKDNTDLPISDCLFDSRIDGESSVVHPVSSHVSSQLNVEISAYTIPAARGEFPGNLSIESFRAFNLGSRDFRSVYENPMR